MLGNGWCEGMCSNDTKRLCHIRGKMHKKVWIAAGDIALVSFREYQDDTTDVILKGVESCFDRIWGNRFRKFGAILL
ncbi:hypothetical protein KSP40_PGU005800 [Platanthera guangdongensis]|uniref:S1-like domain-containing protein n=1 Tax=Platanthera guangdongensis TaxID=2320717 RepID=A0ABR2MDN2_9ASPA